MESEAQRRANVKYKAENTVNLQVKLFPADRDIVEWLDGIDEGKAAYVRRLIREDMAKRSK